MATSQQELQTAVATLEYYREQLEGLARQDELLQAALEEHFQARESAERYRNAERGTEILVPIGGGAYLFGQVADPTQAIVSAGTGVHLRRSLEEVRAHLDTRIGELNETRKRLLERLTQMQAAFTELNKQLQAKYAALQRGQATPEQGADVQSPP